MERTDALGRPCAGVPGGLVFGVALLVLAAGACSGSGAPPLGPPPDEDVPVVEGDHRDDFVSHVAGQSSESGDQSAADAGSAAPERSADGGGEDAARAIAEADIIQVDGDRLFALSRYAGMTVVDLSDPADLRVEGTHRMSATPFELYLRDGVAYVMFNGYWTYAYDEDLGRGSWQSTSRMQALDVSDPAHIRLLGDYEVPGEISDSRMVGDVIYLVTYENGGCWGCAQMPNTRVASFDAGDPTAFTRIDELRFESQNGSWGARSISVNAQRMYVAGPHWSQEDQGGTIQVVDISDASGTLELGSEVEIAGRIDNRWQMDEHEGVLRVISQAGGWNSTAPPVVETFAVASAGEVTPLGQLSMTLPRPEDLRSVRFDGDRAYAITFERTDPLFTLDLSDPAQPRQMGELEIPGWVYHMEPRGDRIYGLGFDDAAEGRGLTVSIFDVSDMTAPTMLDRVVFGGEWAWQVEDQDRIHKAFNLMLDEGLILVPFAGSQRDEATCNYRFESGIQIISVAQDDLILRGVAPQIGTARRSLVHADTLFGISDNAIQAFDIDDLDAPLALDALEVARNVSSVHVVGDHILRFGNDWWTGRTLLDFASPEDASTAEPLGEIDLSNLFEDEADQCTSNSYWGGSVHVQGDFAYVPRYHNRRGESSAGGWSRESGLTIYVVDLRDHESPQIAGSFEVDPAVQRESSSRYEHESFGSILMTDSALLVGRVQGSYRYSPSTEEREEPRHFYDVFSIEDPGAPVFTTRFEVPSSIAGGGWGYGPAGCGLDMGWGWWYPGHGSTSAFVSGDIVASNHAEPLEDGTGRVRYYLDRLDVSDPARPVMLSPVNIPGQLAYFNDEQGQLVTLEDELRTTSASDWDECWGQGSRVAFDDAEDQCRIWDRYLNALVLDGNRAVRVSRANLDSDGISRSVAISSERVFVTTGERVRWDHHEPTTREIRSFAIASNGQLQILPTVELEAQAGWWWPQLVARGARAFMTQSNTLTVVDTTTKTEPTLVEHEMPGWHCGSLQVAGDRAYCAMGQHGVLSFDL